MVLYTSNLYYIYLQSHIMYKGTVYCILYKDLLVIIKYTQCNHKGGIYTEVIKKI
jgi:hypothetical protein